jgi:hypothetical protein
MPSKSAVSTKNITNKYALLAVEELPVPPPKRALGAWASPLVVKELPKEPPTPAEEIAIQKLDFRVLPVPKVAPVAMKAIFASWDQEEWDEDADTNPVA